MPLDSVVLDSKEGTLKPALHQLENECSVAKLGGYATDFYQVSNRPSPGKMT